ncbi:hypothetical protein [Streptomyces sp. NPDC048603]
MCRSRVIAAAAAVAFVPPARYDVIRVSSCMRCRLRGRHRMPVTHF